MSNRLGYIRALDGLRGLAVLGVLAAHAAPQFERFGIGVDLFFVISGYLITRILVAERVATGGIGLRRFYRRRMARLYPALALVAVVTAAVYAMVELPESDATVLGAATSLTYTTAFAHLWGYDAGWLGHTWSLSVEEVFYLVWPLVLLVGRDREASVGRRVVTMFALALAWHLVLMAVADQVWLHNGPDSRAVQLLAGGVLAVALGDRLARSRWMAAAAVVGALWFVAHGALDLLTPNQGSLLATAGAGAAATSYAIGRPDNRALSSRPLVWVGERSYSLYLVHFPLFGLHSDHWSTSVDYAVRGLAIVASFVAADLLFRFWEQPWRTRLSGRRPAPSSDPSAAGADGAAADQPAAPVA